MTTWTTIICKT